MADLSSNLSIRMSSEDQSIEDRFSFESVLQHFKKHKVEISNAVKKPFPFLEGLRDRELITNKMYEDLQDSHRNLVPVHNVIYKVLEELEKKFNLTVLEALFSEVNMDEYPDLKHIFRTFENVIQNQVCSQGGSGEDGEEDPNSQLSLEQGPGENCSQGSLAWSPLDPCCSAGYRSNERRNSNQGNKTESCRLSNPLSHTGISLLENGVCEHFCETVQMNGEKQDMGIDKNDTPERPEASKSYAPESEPADSCELIEVQVHSAGASLEAPSPLPWSKERVEPLSSGIQINPCSVHLVDIKKEKSSFYSEKQPNQARSNHNQASSIIVITSEDSDDGEEASTSALSWPKPVDSRKSSIVTERFRKRDSSDTGSKSSKRTHKRTRHTTDVGNNSTMPKDCGKRISQILQGLHLGLGDLTHPGRKRSKCGSYFIQNIKTPMQRVWSKGRRVNSRTSKRDRKESCCVSPWKSYGRDQYPTGPRIARGNSVNFDLPELPVTCGDVKGTLYKEKLKQGVWKRSIQSEDGRWFTPRQFEIKGNRTKSKKWKLSIRCDGWTLKELIEKGHLPNPPRAKKVTLQPSVKTPEGTVYKPLKSSRKCKVCHQGKKLYSCACGKSYHKNCHIPPVESERNLWHCTFCKTKAIRLRCQESQPCYEESEILRKRMLPEEQLKCELLLLIIYCHPESNFFVKRPYQKKEDFPGIQEYMWLNKIKNRLNKKVYHKVQRFVQDIRLIFHNHSIFYKGQKCASLGATVGTQFEMKFKSIFSIRDTSKKNQQIKPIILLT